MARNLWQDDTVAWFRRALQESGLADAAMEVLGPLVRPQDTVLDLGCGPGTLSIPLAQRVARVTALDSSEAMLRGLREDAEAAGLTNITCVHRDWDAAKATLDRHDVVLIANAPGIVRDVPAFLPVAHALARRYVVIILGAGGRRTDKFFNRELRALLGLPAPTRRKDYLEQYTALHAHGVCANVRIIAYDFDQPFADWADAVAFHRAHLRLETDAHDAAIEAFLRERLTETGAGPRLPMPKRSAVMWWAPPGA